MFLACLAMCAVVDDAERTAFTGGFFLIVSTFHNWLAHSNSAITHDWLKSNVNRWILVKPGYRAWRRCRSLRPLISIFSKVAMEFFPMRQKIRVTNPCRLGFNQAHDVWAQWSIHTSNQVSVPQSNQTFTVKRYFVTVLECAEKATWTNNIFCHIVDCVDSLPCWRLCFSEGGVNHVITSLFWLRRLRNYNLL